MSKRLQVFSQEQFRGLSEKESKLQVHKINQLWKTYSDEIQEFVYWVNDDFSRPTIDQVMPFLWQLLAAGEIIFCLEDNRLIGIAYLCTTNGGRSFNLTVFDRVGTLGQFVDSIVARAFDAGAIKVTAAVAEGKAEGPMLFKAGFEYAGKLRADSLIQGSLIDTILLERYHPQLTAPVSEEIEIDGREDQCLGASERGVHAVVSDELPESDDGDVAGQPLQAAADSAAGTGVPAVQQQPTSVFADNSEYRADAGGSSEVGLHEQDAESDDSGSVDKRTKRRSKQHVRSR